MLIEDPFTGEMVKAPSTLDMTFELIKKPFEWARLRFVTKGLDWINEFAHKYLNPLGKAEERLGKLGRNSKLRYINPFYEYKILGEEISPIDIITRPHEFLKLGASRLKKGKRTFLKTAGVKTLEFSYAPGQVFLAPETVIEGIENRITGRSTPSLILKQVGILTGDESHARNADAVFGGIGGLKPVQLVQYAY